MAVTVQIVSVTLGQRRGEELSDSTRTVGEDSQFIAGAQRVVVLQEGQNTQVK